MARQQFNIAPPNTISQVILYGVRGDVILQIGYEDYTIRTPSGDIEQHKTSKYIQTVDGRQWNPLMMLAKPPIHVGVCEHCRNPPFSWLGREAPTHGIVTLENAKRCTDCGTLCCHPKHVKQGSDGFYHCIQCANRFTRSLARILKAIFFDNGEDT
jgi:hypothetical protein